MLAKENNKAALQSCGGCLEEKMGNTYKVILGILGEALFQCAYELPADVDGDTVFQEAFTQGVFPIVYAHVGITGKVKTSDKWRRLYLENFGNNSRVLCEHMELLDAMGEIPFTTIKGAQSAYYYPNPVNRAMGDVDFIVHKEDIEKVKVILQNIGFQWNGDGEHDAHMVFYRGCLGVWEMHWQLSGIPNGKSGQRAREEARNIIETSTVLEVGGLRCRMADEFHHCLVMLTHTANHMINTGVGLRHICDWAVFANKVDVNQWKDKLKSCGLWRFAQILTQVSVCYLHMPLQEWAMEDVDHAVLKAFILDVFDAGNFGEKDPGRINQAKLMTDKDIGGVDDTSMVVRLFREVNNRAKEAVPACRKMVVLRPLAWGYVLVRHAVRIRKGERPKIQVQSMLQGAEKRRALYQMFRLYNKEV